MTSWLSPEEQLAWRSWLTATTLLPDQLGRDLQDSHGISLADYDILVQLSEADGNSLRMSDLAERTLVSRSRLTHQVDRMEREGLVARRVCREDARGLLACLTDKGWSILQTAAPDHVESVRARMVDVLSPEELRVIGDASRKIVEALGGTVQIPPTQ